MEPHDCHDKIKVQGSAIVFALIREDSLSGDQSTGQGQIVVLANGFKSSRLP
jgi:hypothetical protein